MTNKVIEETLTPLQQRLLAIGLLLLLLLILTLLIIMPLINMTLKLHEQKHNLVFKLQRYEKIIATKKDVLAGIHAIKQNNVAQNYFNNEETEALASANVQELLKKIIQDAGGQLHSTQVVTDDMASNDKFTRIAVKVNMIGNSAILRTVLYNIENSIPLIIINQMNIKPVRNTKTGMTFTNQLEVDFQAVSFMRKPLDDYD